jgi:hypothetical protein
MVGMIINETGGVLRKFYGTLFSAAPVVATFVALAATAVVAMTASS